MPYADIRDQVQEIVCALLNLENTRLDDEVLLTDYGLTSIDLLDVVTRLETHFRVQFDPAAMAQLSVGSLARNVSELIAA